jgi:hypothetical protein
MKVMSAIERCRTAALGGHVARCENEECAHIIIAYNSCLMGKFRNGESAAWLDSHLAAYRAFPCRSTCRLLSITTAPTDKAALPDGPLAAQGIRKCPFVDSRSNITEICMAAMKALFRSIRKMSPSSLWKS